MVGMVGTRGRAQSGLHHDYLPSTSAASLVERRAQSSLGHRPGCFLLKWQECEKKWFCDMELVYSPDACHSFILDFYDQSRYRNSSAKCIPRKYFLLEDVNSIFVMEVSLLLFLLNLFLRKSHLVGVLGWKFQHNMFLVVLEICDCNQAWQQQQSITSRSTNSRIFFGGFCKSMTWHTSNSNSIQKNMF